MKNIIVEVGANSGTDTEKFLANSENFVYSFEPTPNLISILKSKFGSNDNFVLIEKAVDTDNGEKTFNIAGTGDWGCSSLHTFSPDIHEKWVGRPDFTFTDQIIVSTIRLDQFMSDYNIQTIDYLWIDAQGNDFRVLKSLGDRISDVKQGKCEGAYTVDLYSGVENNCYEISRWLSSKGFICNIVPDAVNKEADIHFVRDKS